MVSAEAAERVREQIHAGGGGGADADGARLEPCEPAQLLLSGRERQERLAGVEGEQLPRLGEAAAAAAPLDKPLAGGAFEETQVLARRRLADPDRACGGGNAPLTPDLDEQPQSSGVPDERERAIGQGDTSYRDIRLVPWYADA